MKASFFGLAAAALFATSALAQQAATLTLNLDTASAEGRVLIAIYDSEASVDRGGAPVRALEARPGAPVHVEGLAPGRYGVKAFHDLDGDGEMGSNPFGVPTEPYAFSNGTRPHGGPPAWREAAFEVPASGAIHTLTFR